MSGDYDGRGQQQKTKGKGELRVYRQPSPLLLHWYTCMSWNGKTGSNKTSILMGWTSGRPPRLTSIWVKWYLGPEIATDKGRCSNGMRYYITHTLSSHSIHYACTSSVSTFICLTVNPITLSSKRIPCRLRWPSLLPLLLTGDSKTVLCSISFTTYSMTTLTVLRTTS